MKKKLPLIVSLLIIGALGASFLLKKPVNGPTNTIISNPTTFAQLLTMGQDYTCTFESTDEIGNVHRGTVFVADQGNSFRGDFMMMGPNGDQPSHMIRSGEYSYMWGGDEEQGFKMKLDPADERLFPEETEEGDQAPFALDENEEMNFACQPWRPDRDHFTPPGEIEFVDLSAQMELMMEQMQEINPSL